MSAIISMSLVTAAFCNRRKTVTRRTWEDAYAQRFRAGDILQVWDRSPRYKGVCIGRMQLTEAPYRHYTRRHDFMEEYEGEGFGFYDQYPELTPKKWKKIFEEYDVDNFLDYWRLFHHGETLDVRRFDIMDIPPYETTWVVRFKILDVFSPEADKYLLKK